MAIHKALNKAALINLYNIGGKELVVRLIDRFVQATPSRLETAQSCAARQDWRALHLVAHSLKATSANVGADRFRNLAEKLEDLAGLGRGEQMESALEELETEFRAAEIGLRHERLEWQT